MNPDCDLNLLPRLDNYAWGERRARRASLFLQDWACRTIRNIGRTTGQRRKRYSEMVGKVKRVVAKLGSRIRMSECTSELDSLVHADILIRLPSLATTLLTLPTISEYLFRLWPVVRPMFLIVRHAQSCKNSEALRARLFPQA